MKKPVRKSVLFFLVLTVFLGGVTVPHRKAVACPHCLETVTDAFMDDNGLVKPPDGTISVVDTHVMREFIEYRNWYITLFLEDNLLPAMMWMAEQLTVTAMQQTHMFGSMLDAKHQLETQRLLQQLQAQAHKDYHPSIGMCEFGTVARSLAPSERKGEYNAIVMSQRSMDRQLGNANTSAAYGNDLDKESRIAQFKAKFCDPRDNNNGLALMCDAPGTDRNRYNKDIDFTRTVDFPWTLKIDFTDNIPTDHEEEVMALAANLYANEVFARPGAKLLQATTDGSMTDMQKKYIDMRSIIAKRSVAENSFNAITSMKAEGTPESRNFLVAMLNELGVRDGAAAPVALMGDNPSYYAQMEMLTKKIYQNPDFFTNLYDKPVNVDRKGVSMQAIGLMQKFDMFKSYLRTEASLSILLELAVMDLQNEVENEINPHTGAGEPGL